MVLAPVLTPYFLLSNGRLTDVGIAEGLVGSTCPLAWAAETQIIKQLMWLVSIKMNNKASEYEYKIANYAWLWRADSD
jgi:hypothetical protein